MPVKPAKSQSDSVEKRPRRARGGPFAFKRPVLGAIVALIIGVCVLYPEIVFQDKIFVSGDSRAAQSFAAVGERALAEGEYPVWNPYMFCGMPSYASMAYTPWVYPVNWILKPFRRVLPLPEYTWLLVHTLATGLGVFLLLRDRNVRATIAAIAGILMMWMPNLVAIGAYGHGSQACAVAYLPFALLFWDRFWRGQNPAMNAAALAITLGFSMLRSHLQVSYYTYALIALHLLFFGVMSLVDAARRKSYAGPLPARFLRPGDSATWGGALGNIGYGAAVLAIAAGVSLLICAVLYLPVQDYAQYSIRGASDAGGLDYGYATSWSLHPSEMLTFLVPFSFGFGKELYLGHMPFTDYPNYLGVVVLVFAVVAALRVRTRFVGFLIFVAVVATLVSFGKFLPVLYDPLFKFAPYFSKFRVPVMVLIVQQLAVILLFGIGLDHAVTSAMAKDRVRLRRLALRALIAAGVVFVLVLLTQGYWSGSFAQATAAKVRVSDDPSTRAAIARMVGEFLARDLVQLSLIGVLLAGAFFALASARLRPLAFLLMVTGLALADYYRVDRFIIHPERFLKHDAYRLIRDRDTHEAYLRSDESIEFLRKQEGIFRVLPIDDPRNGTQSASFMSNRYMVFGIASAGGYHPAKLAVYDEFMRALSVDIQNWKLDLAGMLNARFIVSSTRLPEHPSLSPVWVGKDYEGNARAIYENTNAFSRAWVVGDYQVITGEDALIALAEGRVDLRHSVVLAEEPAIKPAPGDSAHVAIERWTQKEMVFSAELDRPGILVVSEAYYPDWKATVDGTPAPVLRANHALRAVALSAGRHQVVMRYDDALLKKGASISAGALGFTLLTLVGSWLWQARRKKELWWKRSS